jgi:hypothetical protein
MEHFASIAGSKIKPSRNQHEAGRELCLLGFLFGPEDESDMFL